MNLAGLERDLGEAGARSVRALNRAELTDFFATWRLAFLGGERTERRDHVDCLSLRKDVARRKVAIRVFEQARPWLERYFAGTSDPRVGIVEVEGPLPEYDWWAARFGREDLFLCDGDLRWTFVQDHEGSGPFFAERYEPQ